MGVLWSRLVGFKFGEDLLLLHRWLSSHWSRRAARELSEVSFVRALIPFMKAPSPWPNYLPWAPPPKTISLRVKLHIWILGIINIQSLAVSDLSFTEKAALNSPPTSYIYGLLNEYYHSVSFKFHTFWSNEIEWKGFWHFMFPDNGSCYFCSDHLSPQKQIFNHTSS